MALSADNWWRKAGGALLILGISFSWGLPSPTMAAPSSVEVRNLGISRVGERTMVTVLLNQAANPRVTPYTGANRSQVLIEFPQAQAATLPETLAGDEILVSWLEHHANIVPWQMLCEQTGAVLKVAPIDERGMLRIDLFQEMLSSRTRLVAFTHVSNALGTILPAAELTRMAKAVGARVLLPVVRLAAIRRRQMIGRGRDAVLGENAVLDGDLAFAARLLAAANGLDLDAEHACGIEQIGAGRDLALAAGGLKNDSAGG